MEVIIVLAVWAAVWAAFCWLGWAMAETRNRNKGAWAAVCFLTGFVGVIVLALIGTKQVSPVRQVLSE
jgi:hypothetical protein